MKKIIVPIDFSKHSEFALKAAASIAIKNGAEVMALHMLEMSDTLLTSSDSNEVPKIVYFMKLAEKRFKKFLEKDFLKDINVTPMIKQFKVFSEVNEVAKEHEADLIVMGSHGASGLKEFLVGSNTERVVRNSEIPVLVVKNDLETTDFKTIIFATDFDEEDIRSYLNASSMFDKDGINMILLYINLPNENFRSTQEIESRVTNFLTKADGNLDSIAKVAYQADYTVEQGVLNYANKIDADLIVISTHGRKGISHFFAGSIGEDIANHAIRPVMTFKI
jgi:nucleotide-binding universal stress UspA family protein